MNAAPRKLNLDEWDDRYEQLRRDGLREPGYGGPLQRHVVREKDFRLQQLQFDNSTAALRLWNFFGACLPAIGRTGTAKAEDKPAIADRIA